MSIFRHFLTSPNAKRSIFGTFLGPGGSKNGIFGTFLCTIQRKNPKKWAFFGSGGGQNRLRRPNSAIVRPKKVPGHLYFLMLPPQQQETKGRKHHLIMYCLVYTPFLGFKGGFKGGF